MWQPFRPKCTRTQPQQQQQPAAGTAAGIVLFLEGVKRDVRQLPCFRRVSETISSRSKNACLAAISAKIHKNTAAKETAASSRKTAGIVLYLGFQTWRLAFVLRWQSCLHRGSWKSLCHKRWTSRCPDIRMLWSHHVMCSKILWKKKITWVAYGATHQSLSTCTEVTQVLHVELQNHAVLLSIWWALWGRRQGKHVLHPWKKAIKRIKL